MPKVKFLPAESTIDARDGETLLDIALSAGVPIQHACGGFCACTTCHCEIVEGFENLEKPEEEETERLSVLADPTPHSRLACQTKVKGPVTVRVINHS